MKIKELREKSEQELERMLTDLRDNARESRFKVAARQHVPTRQIRNAKKAIAQILTIRKERSLTAASGAKA